MKKNVEKMLSVGIIEAVVIGVWAFHFTVNLQERGEIFGWVGVWAGKVLDPNWEGAWDSLPSVYGAPAWRYWIWKSLTCGKCHAFYAVAAYLAFKWGFWFGWEGVAAQWLDATTTLFKYTVIASFTAWLLEKKLT